MIAKMVYFSASIFNPNVMLYRKTLQSSYMSIPTSNDNCHSRSNRYNIYNKLKALRSASYNKKKFFANLISNRRTKSTSTQKKNVTLCGWKIFHSSKND